MGRCVCHRWETRLINPNLKDACSWIIGCWDISYSLDKAKKSGFQAHWGMKFRNRSGSSKLLKVGWGVRTTDHATSDQPWRWGAGDGAAHPLMGRRLFLPQEVHMEALGSGSTWKEGRPQWGGTGTYWCVRQLFTCSLQNISQMYCKYMNRAADLSDSFSPEMSRNQSATKNHPKWSDEAGWWYHGFMRLWSPLTSTDGLLMFPSKESTGTVTAWCSPSQSKLAI